MKNILEKHPKTLKIFFATEMWERYGFYVIQTLLILFLTHHFEWADKQAFELVGYFVAITYIAPLFGGFIADHLIGQKKAIVLASIILFFSYSLLGFVHDEAVLLVALACIAVGAGLMKPNISSLLGNAYANDAVHREKGFTIFYMGITTGIILGSTVPSILNEHFGWSIAFYSAAVGLVFALLTFLYGCYRYTIRDYLIFIPEPQTNSKTALYIVLMFSLFLQTLKIPFLGNIIFTAIPLACIFYIGFTAAKEYGEQRRKTLIIGLLCVISTLFWAFYFQMFSSISLLIERTIEPKLFGVSFPPPYYVAAQSVGMIIFGTLMTFTFKSSNRVGNPLTTIANKFMTAMIFLCLAYGLTFLVLVTNISDKLISPLLILPAFFLISIAELLLSPIGLSAITRLAHPKRVSTMMGIFFVSLGTGGFLSGELAKITAVSNLNISILELKQHYSHALMILLGILIGATVIAVVTRLLIGKLLAKNSN